MAKRSLFAYQLWNCECCSGKKKPVYIHHHLIMKCTVYSYLHRKCKVSNFLSQLLLSARVNSSVDMRGLHKVHSITWFAGEFVFTVLWFLYSVSVAPPSVRHTCKEAVCGSVMTHLLHTSLLPGHIWADRKSFFLLCLSSGEEQALQKHYEPSFSAASFLLHSFSKEGHLIWGLRCFYYQTNMVPVLHGYFSMSFIQWGIFWTMNQA